MKSLLKATALGAVVALSACSVLETDKVDYRSTAKAPELSIPPDLTQLNKDTRYTMVDGAFSAAGSKTAAAPVKAAIGADSVGDMRIERLGNQRWLVVKRKADTLWDPIKDFWQDSGFLMAIDESNLGIMETEWAENRAKLPQDVVRATIGKIFDSLYSTPERDKYRTRLETNAAGETEIYITHRGVMEIYVNERSDQTIWQPRPEDPELEAEFLRRLMLKLGGSPDQVTKLLATPSAKPVATVATIDNHPAVRIADNFDRAWRRVGVALDRTGFTVEDRDRNRGIYFVRYVGSELPENKPSFFGKLFSSSPAKDGAASKYQIIVVSDGDSSTVSVRDAQGAPDSSATAQRIVTVIAEDIH